MSPPCVGTTKCVQTCSPVPSAASRTARPVVVPYDWRTHPTVGRDDSARRCRNYRLRTNLPFMSLRDPNGVVAISCTHSQKPPHPCRAEACLRRCRNYQMRTNSFVCTVCRCAVGGDMSPPYRRCMQFFLWAGDAARPYGVSLLHHVRDRLLQLIDGFLRFFPCLGLLRQHQRDYAAGCHAQAEGQQKSFDLHDGYLPMIKIEPRGGNSLPRCAEKTQKVGNCLFFAAVLWYTF